MNSLKVFSVAFGWNIWFWITMWQLLLVHKVGRKFFTQMFRCVWVVPNVNTLIKKLQVISDEWVRFMHTKWKIPHHITFGVFVRSLAASFSVRHDSLVFEYARATEYFR